MKKIYQNSISTIFYHTFINRIRFISNKIHRFHIEDSTTYSFLHWKFRDSADRTQYKCNLNVNYRFCSYQSNILFVAQAQTNLKWTFEAIGETVEIEIIDLFTTNTNNAMMQISAGKTSILKIDPKNLLAIESLAHFSRFVLYFTCLSADRIAYLFKNTHKVISSAINNIVGLKLKCMGLLIGMKAINV